MSREGSTPTPSAAAKDFDEPMKDLNLTEIPKVHFFIKNPDTPEIDVIKFRHLIGRKSRMDHDPGKPHRIDFYAVMYITRGKGVHFIDFKPYSFEPDSMILVSKGQVHAFDLDNLEDGFMILFTDRFLSKNLIHSDILSLHMLYNQHLHHPIILPEQADRKGFMDMILNIDKEFEAPVDPAKEEMLRLWLKLLLLKVERLKQALIPKGTTTDRIHRFVEFKQQIETNMIRTRDAKDYAGMMSISYKHLNETCKAVTGNTAKKFIDEAITLEIKRRLATTSLSVKELTYELGFDEPTNFVKYFLKHAHETPVQFRNSIKK